MNRVRRLASPGVGIILLLALATGCATDSYKGVRLTGDPIVDAPAAIEKGPPRDKVLWQYRAALASMRRGEYGAARRYLDDALARIGNIYGKDRDARKARGYFQNEARKTFVGEPYERVMAYYFRGVIYWMDGEPDNARACFRSAQLMDSDAESKSFASDYVLLDYLDGYVTERLGSDGAESMKRAQESAKMWKPPEFSTRANVLVFVDYGNGPGKYASGQYGEQLRIRPGFSQARSAIVKVEPLTGKAVPYDDLLHQATTRGGRVMDHVLAGKAVFKSTTDTFGNVALITGAVLATQQETQVAGLATMGAGLVSKIIAGATTPDADTRTWDNLPMYLSFVALEVPAGQHTLTVDFLDESNRTISGLTKSVQFTVPDGNRDKVIYVSDKSTTPQTL